MWWHLVTLSWGESNDSTVGGFVISPSPFEVSDVGRVYQRYHKWVLVVTHCGAVYGCPFPEYRGSGTRRSWCRAPFVTYTDNTGGNNLPREGRLEHKTGSTSRCYSLDWLNHWVSVTRCATASYRLRLSRMGQSVGEFYRDGSILL
jgi:hypothetical protein